MPKLRALILAPLFISASCFNKPPERLVVQHPNAADLICPAEPDLASSLAADASGLQFEKDVLLAGRGCRDALARVCKWHVMRGLALPGGVRCNDEATPSQ